MYPKLLLTGILLASAAPVWAQAAPPAQEPAPESMDELDMEPEAEEIVVTGQRERGSVAGDIPPVQQLRPADIRSYGVGTVNELLYGLMANAVGGGKGARGPKKASQQGIAGLALQNRLPNARVLYVSATGATTPRVSLWLTGLKETVDQLPAFVRLAAEMGVAEVHLQLAIRQWEHAAAAGPLEPRLQQRLATARALALGGPSAAR